METETKKSEIKIKRVAYTDLELDDFMRFEARVAGQKPNPADPTKKGDPTKKDDKGNPDQPGDPDDGADENFGGGPLEDPGPPPMSDVPGLETPFPGEHPQRAPEPKSNEPDTSETKTVAGPKITDIKSGLDAAVDSAFSRIDLAQLEKDWLEFIKKHG